MTEQEWGIGLGAEGATLDTEGAVIEGMQGRQRSALAMYRVHRDAKALGEYRLLTYRCPRRCLLLDVFRTPAGPAVYFPPFKLSPDENERTSPDARTERTTDGERRWIERAEMLNVFRGGLYLEVNCDHVARKILTGERIRSELETRPLGDTITVQSESLTQ